MTRIAFILLLSISSAFTFAQKVEVVVDSTGQSGDSLQVRKGGKIITAESYAKRYQPRKALLYSAVVPGLGQAYNKKYWKLPIVYGGLFLLTSVALTYNTLYDKYKTELFGLLETPSIPPPSGFTEDQLRSLTDTYRRNRDFFLILDGFWYLLQLLDAHVDAHLREFDLNPQLKISLQPAVQQNSLLGRTSGLSLTIKF